MKHIALAFIILAAACGSPSSNTTTVRKDTVYTPVLYMENWRNGQYASGTAEKTWSEVLKPDPKDSTKNVRVIDSAYRLAIYFHVRDTISPGVSVPKLDSLGQPVIKFIGVNALPKAYIVKDFNIDLLKLKP